MKPVIGFDTETFLNRNQAHSFLCFQVFSKDLGVKAIVYTIDEVSRFFTRRLSKALWFGFNIEFDVTVLAKALKGKGFEIKVFRSSSHAVKAEISKNKYKWRLFDLKMITRASSLRRLGEAVKVPKLDKPFFLGRPDIKEFLRDPYHRMRFEEYALRDAEICYYAGKWVLTEFGKVRPTSGSLAVSVFRKHLPYAFKSPEFQDATLAKLRRAYKGGRTEAFVRGTPKGKVKYYDVNSMYPFVMYSGTYPLICKAPFGRYVRKSSVNLDFEGVALAKVKVEGDVTPLGVRRRCKDGFERLIFPEGVIVDWFTYPELRALESYGGKILKVYEAYEWKVIFNPFKPFIKHFYGKKLEAEREGNKVARLMYKTIMNSLYGKFGEHKGGKIIDLSDYPYIKVLENNDMKHRWYHNVVWSAYVTAYARLHLFKIIRNIPYNKLYYCDTDSLIVDGSISLPTSKRLGDLKLEGETKYPFFTAIRTKFYLFGSALKMRGFYVPQGADLVRACLLKNIRFVPQRIIVKPLLAKRLGVEALKEVVKPKFFTFAEDGKRKYLRKLSPKGLLTDFTPSKPLELKEDAVM